MEVEGGRVVVGGKKRVGAEVGKELGELLGENGVE